MQPSSPSYQLSWTNSQSVTPSSFLGYSKELTAFTQHATTPSALLSARERKQSQLIGHFSSCNQSGLRILDRSALLRDECVKQSINPPPPPPLHARDLFSYSWLYYWDSNPSSPSLFSYSPVEKVISYPIINTQTLYNKQEEEEPGMKWRRRSVHQDLENCISLASFLSLSRGTLEEEGGEDTSKVAALQLTFLLLTQ